MMKLVIFWINPLCITVTILLFILILPEQTLGLDDTMGSESSDSKIVGGHPVASHLYPWEVSIALSKNIPPSAQARSQMAPLLKESVHHCDGILVNPIWVLTAAHCVVDLVTKKTFDPPGQLQVGVGSKDLDEIFDRGRIPVIQIQIQFSTYQPGQPTSPADIALIRLAHPVTGIPFACIGISHQMFYPGALTGVGFGNTQTLYYNIATNEIVKGIHPTRVLKEATVVDITPEANGNPKARYCKGRRDLICITTLMSPDSTCQGDSGGSLIFQNKVIGVTSFGDSRVQDSDTRITCIGQTSYTRLSVHLGWISSILGDQFCMA